MYKVSQLVLILALCGTAGKSSLPKLHLLNWALRDGRRVRSLKEALPSKRLGLMAWGFDPALAIALRFAVAEGLVLESKGRIQLSSKGEAFAKDVMEGEGMLDEDVAMLRSIGKGVTEKMVDEAAGAWELR